MKPRIVYIASRYWVAAKLYLLLIAGCFGWVGLIKAPSCLETDAGLLKLSGEVRPWVLPGFNKFFKS